MVAAHKIAATVQIGGRVIALIATVRGFQPVSARNQQRLQFDLSKDDGGDRVGPEARQSDAQLRDPALEGVPANLNLDFIGPEINADAVPAAALRDIARMAQAELAGAGLAGKVSPHVVRGLLGTSGVLIGGR